MKNLNERRLPVKVKRCLAYIALSWPRTFKLVYEVPGESVVEVTPRLISLYRFLFGNYYV